jgi:hypothetical protein
MPVPAPRTIPAAPQATRALRSLAADRVPGLSRPARCDTATVLTVAVSHCDGPCLPAE